MSCCLTAAAQNNGPDSTKSAHWPLHASAGEALVDSTNESADHVAADSADTDFWVFGGSEVRFTVLPVLFSSPDTRLGVGAVPHLVFRTSEEARSSNAKLEATYTQNQQFNVRLSTAIWFPDNRHGLDLRIQLQDWPTTFYGVGNNAPAEWREKYSSRILITTAEFQTRVATSTYAGLRHDIRYDDIVSIEEGGLLDAGEIRGSSGGFSSGMGAFVGYDTRDHVLYPTDGMLLRAGTRVFLPAWGSEFGYARHRLEGRSYYSLSDERVLAGQLVLAFASGDPPFQMYSTVGELLRAYSSSRYIDRNMLAARLEFRETPLWWRFGYALFAEAGQVGPTYGDFDLSSVHLSAGFGVRFQLIPSERVLLRWDFALGTRTTGTHLDIGEEF